MTTDRVRQIEERLKSALNPCSVQVSDDSHRHVGHAGAKDGRGHFSVTIVSDHFDDHPAIARHRLVYEALGDLMRTDIHALSIKAFTTKEKP